MNIISIQEGKLAQNKLQEKMTMIKKFKEESKNKSVEPEKQKLAQELRDLFNYTQAIDGIQNITEEEIDAGIEAYGRGK